MRDPNNYEDQERFDPLRFYSPAGSAGAGIPDLDAVTTKYTDVNWKYPFWGSQKHSWYAISIDVSFLMEQMAHDHGR